MKTDLVLTLVGEDRAGMVQDAAKCVVLVGGNWLESRMTRLAGKFAGVARISVPDEAILSLRQALDEIEGMSVQLEEAGELQDNPQLRRFTLSIIGPDRPGILRHLAGVNVVVDDGGQRPKGGQI